MRLSMSFHAAARLRERNIRERAVEQALRYGREERQGGNRIRYVIDEEAVDEASLQHEDIRGLLGMVAVVADDSALLTAFYQLKESQR